MEKEVTEGGGTLLSRQGKLALHFLPEVMSWLTAHTAASVAKSQPKQPEERRGAVPARRHTGGLDMA